MECSDCGRDLQPDFNFCPGCGKAIDANDQFKQSVDESFDKLEEVVKGDTLLRLENLSTRLDSMEQELEMFLTSENVQR